MAPANRFRQDLQQTASSLILAPNVTTLDALEKPGSRLIARARLHLPVIGLCESAFGAFDLRFRQSLHFDFAVDNEDYVLRAALSHASDSVCSGIGHRFFVAALEALEHGASFLFLRNHETATLGTVLHSPKRHVSRGTYTSRPPWVRADLTRLYALSSTTSIYPLRHLLGVTEDLDYEKLLERVYELVPPRKVKRERLEVEPPEVVVSGKRTFIMNFKRICDILNRDPRLVLRYLLKELGASGNVEGDAAVVYGVATPKMIKDLLDFFMKNYVICPVCGSPDTILGREERKVMQLKCMACGAVSPVKPF